MYPKKLFEPNLYHSLLTISSDYESLIKKDINRTYPNERFFLTDDENSSSEGQKSLLDVLLAITNYFPDMGYC